MDKQLTVNIDGRDQRITVPDDATPEEIDEAVNRDFGQRQLTPKGFAAQPGFLSLPPQEKTAQVEAAVHGPKAPIPFSILNAIANYPRESALAKAEESQYYPEIGRGIAKGIGHTAYGIATLPYPAAPDPEILKPKTPLEQRAFQAEQIGEYFVPSALGEKAVSKLPALARDAPWLARTGRQLIRAGAQAAGAGGLTAVQTGSSEEALKAAAAAGGGTLGFGGLGFLIKKLGLEIGLKTIRPSIAVTRISPYDPKVASREIIGNMYKHNLGGTLDQTATKTEQALLQLTAQLEDIIRQRPLATVNLLDHIAQVERELQIRVKALPLTTVQGMRGALDWLLDATTAQYPTGVATLAEAQNYKRNISRLGSWFYGQRDPRADAMEEVANNLYSKLKTTIETTSGLPAEVQRINRDISELIPIERAVIERIPVAARNSLFNVSDLIAITPAVNVDNWWPFIINRLVKAPWIANVAVKGGEKLGRAAPRLGTAAAASYDVSQRPETLPAPPVSNQRGALPPPKTSDEYLAWLLRQ